MDLAADEPLTIIANLTQLEVMAAWRRLVLRGLMEAAWAEQCVHRMQGWPVITREALTQADLDRAWELRQNFKTYDAAYLAVTERLMSEHRRTDVALATLDLRLARANHLPVPVQIPPFLDEGNTPT